MSEKVYIHQTFTDYVSDYTVWYVNMLDVTAGYGRLSYLICLKRQTFTNCVSSYEKIEK